MLNLEPGHLKAGGANMLLTPANVPKYLEKNPNAIRKIQVTFFILVQFRV